MTLASRTKTNKLYLLTCECGCYTNVPLVRMRSGELVFKNLQNGMELSNIEPDEDLELVRGVEIKLRPERRKR